MEKNDAGADSVAAALDEEADGVEGAAADGADFAAGAVEEDDAVGAVAVALEPADGADGAGTSFIRATPAGASVTGSMRRPMVTPGSADAIVSCTDPPPVGVSGAGSELVVAAVSPADAEAEIAGVGEVCTSSRRLILDNGPVAGAGDDDGRPMSSADTTLFHE